MAGRVCELAADPRNAVRRIVQELERYWRLAVCVALGSHPCGSGSRHTRRAGLVRSRRHGRSVPDARIDLDEQLLTHDAA